MINKILYKTAGLGGTFDRLHDGHKDFIRYAASFSKELHIGVTNQKMTLSKPFNKTIESPAVRAKAVKNFCAEEGIRAKIIELKDPFGPTLEKKSVEAVVCTTDTERGAEKINEIRSKMGLKELPIHVHQLLLDKDGFGPINSSRIREGEIDREGNVFSQLIRQDIFLNQEQREFFAKAQGEIVEKPSKPEYFTCVVGDSTLEQFVKNGWSYHLGIFDGKRKREVFESEILDQLEIDERVSNPPGKIGEEMSNILKKWAELRDFKHIFVDGEEDLAAVSLVFLLPLGSHVYYGQPDEGIVEMVVTEGLKHRMFEALFHLD